MCVKHFRYDLNPGWSDMQASLALVFREAPWSLRRGLYVRSGDSSAAFSLYIGRVHRPHSVQMT